MEKQTKEIKEVSFNEFIKGAVNDGFHTKVIYDVKTIKLEQIYPDKEFMKKHSSQVITDLISEYSKYDNLSSRELISLALNEGSDIYNNKVMPEADIYDAENLAKQTPEKMIEIGDTLQRLSYLQNIFIFNTIKFLIETTMEGDATWFINFAKDHNSKIPAHDIAWDLYMVVSCVIPFRFGFFKTSLDLISLKSMTSTGKTVPDFYCRLAKEFDLITEDEYNSLIETIKNNNSTLNN